MWVRSVLLVSGILTLVVVAIPQLVALGYILLIAPGVILAWAPTVFIYTATFAMVRRFVPITRFLPVTRPLAVNLAAAVLTLGLGVLAALPKALAARWDFYWAATGDVVPAKRVDIAGNVLLISDTFRLDDTDRSRRVPCDALCAALLDTPGVTTVTIAGADFRGKRVEPISYRLVPKSLVPKSNATAGEVRPDAGSNASSNASSNTLAPTRPEQILEYLPDKAASSGPRDLQADMAARNARETWIVARWGLRLANDVTLSAVPAPAHHDLTITMTSSVRRGPHYLTVKQVDVRDPEGRVLLRRQHVTVTTVSMPLTLELYYPFSVSARWQLARHDLQTSDRFDDINPITVLFEETTLAPPPEPGAGVTGVRERLAAALTQPGAPPDLLLANPWLTTIDWQSISDDDVELLGKLIADTRVPDLPRLFEGADRYVRPELRGAIVARLLNPATSRELRFRLNRLLRFMPPGTFAASTPDEVALLHDQSLRLTTSGLVERLADQGKASVPELLRILQEDVGVQPWAARQSMLAAVRRAFIRLGPDAAGALPTVIALFDRPDSPLTTAHTEEDDWRVAMVRMGRPIEDVPFPPRPLAQQVAYHRSVIMQSVERYEAHPDWWQRP
jgi:hypothetical protein